MLFPACSFIFLAFLSQVMTSAFKAIPTRFFFKNVYLKHVRVYLKMLAHAHNHGRELIISEKQENGWRF